MTHKHKVQVQPVENGRVNLNEVKQEHEFDSKEYALEYVEGFNDMSETFRGGPAFKAVYLGRVNDITGELE